MFDFMHEAGSLICSQVHPLEGSVLLPLCARCEGLYLSCALALLSLFLPDRRIEKYPSAQSFLLAVALVSITVLHAFLGTNATGLERFAAGAFGGAGIAVLLGARANFAILAAVGTILLASFDFWFLRSLLALATPLTMLVTFVVPLVVIARGIRGGVLSENCRPLSCEHKS